MGPQPGWESGAVAGTAAGGSADVELCLGPGARVERGALPHPPNVALQNPLPQGDMSSTLETTIIVGSHFIHRALKQGGFKLLLNLPCLGQAGDIHSLSAALT